MFLRPDESETRRRWIKWTERQLCTTCAAGDGAGSGAEMDVLNRNDETFMRMALREACKAADQNEVPVGAGGRGQWPSGSPGFQPSRNAPRRDGTRRDSGADAGVECAWLLAAFGSHLVRNQGTGVRCAPGRW